MKTPQRSPIVATFERIDRIRSVSEALSALRALDRDEMTCVIGYGLASPERGGYWALILATINDTAGMKLADPMPTLVRDELWSALCTRVTWYVRRGYRLKSIPEETRIAFVYMCGIYNREPSAVMATMVVR